MAVIPVATSLWHEVNKSEPCPICGHTDWCRINGNWVVCRRVDTGRGIHRVDKSGADYWLYRLDEAMGPVSVNSLPDPPQTEPERAEDSILYKVYTSLLRALTLSDAHRESLRKRGLSDEEIDKRKYRTLPLQGRAGLARQMADSYGADLLLKVPGFYVHEEGGKRWLTLAGAPGLLIPVRDLSGQIVAIKIRADDPGEGPKYTWLSSSKHGGPSPGNRVHVPAFGGERTSIRITEGELKADIATALSRILTLSIPGVSSWRQVLPVLKECGAKTVRLAFDADAKTNPNVARAFGLTAKALEQEGYEIEVETWDIAEGKGIDDLLAAGGRPAVLKGEDSLCAVDDILNSAGVELLPRIRADLQDLREVSEQAIAALKQANDKRPYLFLRGGPVRIEPDDDGQMITRELTPDRLRHEMARVARWYKLDKDGDEVPAKPPLDVARDVLASPKLPFPVLSAITQSPTFGPDGTLETEPGYHPKSRCYFVNSCPIPQVPDRPTTTEIECAKDLILAELLGDFPFAEEGDTEEKRNADRCHAVALFLLPFVRHMIKSPTPLHLIEASSQGAGKGLLADILLYPALGKSVAVIPPPRDDEELRKSITSRLREGRAAVLLDNVYGLYSAVLAAALTADTWDDRVLGRSETVTLPIRWVWVATANNASVSTDIARRSIRIRLTPKQDRPWLRNDFRHPELRTWAAEHRGELIWAALTIIQNWIANGKPAPASQSFKPLGSFESWSRVMGGILECAGIKGFLANVLDFYEIADTEGAMWRQFVTVWWEKFGNQAVKASDLFPIAQEIDVFDLGKGATERAQRMAFGHKLSKQKDRIFGDFRIEAAGVDHHARLWRLNQIGTSDGASYDYAYDDDEPF